MKPAIKNLIVPRSYLYKIKYNCRFYSHVFYNILYKILQCRPTQVYQKLHYNYNKIHKHTQKKILPVHCCPDAYPAVADAVAAAVVVEIVPVLAVTSAAAAVAVLTAPAPALSPRPPCCPPCTAYVGGS